MPLTPQGRDLVANATFAGIPQPAAQWVALHDVDDIEVPTGPEYARQFVSFGPADGGTVRNTTAFTFNLPESVVGYVYVYTEAVGGIPVVYELLDMPETFAESDAATFAVGDLTITID